MRIQLPTKGLCKFLSFSLGLLFSSGSLLASPPSLRNRKSRKVAGNNL